MPLRVLHVVIGLDTGGAETMLARIINRSDRERFHHAVVSLTTIGSVGETLLRDGVDVTALGIRHRLPNPFLLLRLRGIIRRFRPDVVKSWLYHANFATALTVRGRAPIIWSVFYVPPEVWLNRPTRAIAKLCARLSRSVPRRIVFDSQAAAARHEQLGYDREKFVVIPNGFDTTRFAPDAGARVALRHELGLPPETPIVGLVARFDPVKDHHTFLQAAAQLRRDVPGVAFVLCGGTGITEDNGVLRQWIDELGLRDAIHLLGRREELPFLMAALDIGVSSSAAESFPLVVGELMASGVPCVVTDVGDTALLAGDTAIVVPPCDAGALAVACSVLLRASAEERQLRGLAGRERIIDQFGLAATTEAYEQLFEEVAALPGCKRQLPPTGWGSHVEN